MADAPSGIRGLFYHYIGTEGKRFPFLATLRVHRAQAPPEGQDPPPLADLHPGDIVEVAPVTVLGPGDLHPETGVVVTETIEISGIVKHPDLEPIHDAEAVNTGFVYVQEASSGAPATAESTTAPVEPAPEPVSPVPASPVEAPSALKTPEESDTP